MKTVKTLFLSPLFYLALILLLSLFVRFYKLAEYPTGFHIDEANIGYVAYSLLLTGKDPDGYPHPLYTSVFNDDDPTGYHYLTTIPVKIFGMTVFATRFMSAFFGSLLCLVVYLLTITIFKNRTIALVNALIAALSPWSIVLSRGGEESLLGMFFVLLGFTLILVSFEKRKLLMLFLGALSLIVSFYMYHTPRVFVPLLLFVLIAYYLLFIETKWKRYMKYKIILVVTFLIVSFISAFLVLGVSGGTNRFNQVSIFTFPQTQLVLNEAIREDGVKHTSVFMTRLFHNKISAYAQTYLSNYFSYFTGDFLFLSGGQPIIFKVPQMGLFYILEFPFLLIGIIALCVSKNKTHKIPLIWFILGPAVAAITYDDSPNIRRAIEMFPMVDVISVYGFYLFMQTFPKWKKAIVPIAAVLLMFNTAYFFHEFFINASVHQTWYRNNGTDKMMAIVNSSYNSVNKVVITKSDGGIYPLVLFYSHFDPAIYQKEGSPKDTSYAGFGKFYFVPDICPSTSSIKQLDGVKNILYVDNPECNTPADRKTQYVYREDGTKAFRLVYSNAK